METRTPRDVNYLLYGVVERRHSVATANQGTTDTTLRGRLPGGELGLGSPFDRRRMTGRFILCLGASAVRSGCYARDEACDGLCCAQTDAREALAAAAS